MVSFGVCMCARFGSGSSLMKLPSKKKVVKKGQGKRREGNENEIGATFVIRSIGVVTVRSPRLDTASAVAA